MRLKRETARELPVPPVPRGGLPHAPQVTDEEVRQIARQRWPIVLRDMLDIVRALYEHAGVPADRAEETAIAVTSALAHYFGGRMLYVPRGEALATGMLHLQMYRKFNGRNHWLLAEKYGMNIVTVYDVLKKQHAFMVKELRSREAKADSDRS